VNRLDLREPARVTLKKGRTVADDAEQERNRQQALAALERERQEAIKVAKEAEAEAKREEARRKAEAIAQLQAMEARENQERNK
jgi:hypothetical protein